MDTVVNGEAPIVGVVVIAVQARAFVGTLKALLLTVLMDAPEVIDTLIDGTLVGIATEERRGKREESDILHLQFKDG